MKPEIIVAYIAILFTLLGIFIQIRAKRKDDKLAAQLERLDKQLSDLYGPLYALYESGDKQWRAFLKEFSPHKDPEYFLGFFPTPEKDFPPPTQEQLRVFRLWTKTVFIHRNTRMEEIIINNANLLIGDKMPQPFLDFCVHIASLRASIAEWDEPDFDKRDWRKHLAIFDHPAFEIYVIIKVSFEVLKKEQDLILSRQKSDVNEIQLQKEIKHKIKTIKSNFKKSQTPKTAEEKRKIYFFYKYHAFNLNKNIFKKVFAIIAYLWKF